MRRSWPTVGASSPAEGSRPARGVKTALAIAAILFAACTGEERAARPGEDARALRRAVTARLSGEGEAAAAPRALVRFYEAREFRPAWIEGEGPVETLFDILGQARSHGLDPDDYGRADLRARLRRLEDGGLDAAARLALEVDLSETFLRFASDLATGRVRPGELDGEWHIETREVDLSAAITALAEGGTGAGEIVSSLAPPHPEYRSLRRALARYRKLVRDGGWPEVRGGPALEPGDTADPVRLARLRERLAAEGYDAGASPAGEGRYDEGLAGLVAEFQRRHGIEPDGVLGAATVRELDVPAAARVRTIELNLERWRWMPADLGQRHLRVDVASFDLELREGRRVTLAMRIVVGKEGWGTPFFRDRITHVVVNPEWDVPASIAAEDVVPKVREDPGWLARERFVVLGGRGDHAREIDPATVDWSAIDPTNLPFRFRQLPGPGNALGRLKFVFPNRFAIYLHDTPAKALFAKVDRAFSHGCIRVEEPVALAEALLPEWDRARLLEAIETGRSRRIDLAEPLPVHILYWTASVGEAGRVRFDQDLYGVDEALDRALRARRAGASRQAYSASSSISSPISSAPSLVSSQASFDPSFVAS